MDPSFTAPLWAVLMTLVLGCGAGWAVYFALHIYWPRQRGRDFESWIENGRVLAIRVIDTDAAAAGAKRELFEWIGQLPADFNPTLFLSVDLGTGIHRAVLYEAERRGLVAVGTFERVYGMPMAAIHPEHTGVVPAATAAPATLAVVPPPAAVVAPRATLPTDVHELGAWLVDDPAGVMRNA